MKSLRLAVAALSFVLGTAPAFAADPPAIPILPEGFAGWQTQGAIQASKDAAAADLGNAALLKEYGFTGFESATYTRDDGRKLTIKAARFADASGAYGAFTFYKWPEMLKEEIGDQGSSLNQRVLFYRGNVLVDALFEKLTAMSAAELRELAGLLPLPAGSARNLPLLPTYLPRQSYVKNTAKYVMGPVALDQVGAPIPASLVDFPAGAEVMLGKYNSSGGEVTLMLISYPTPQMAAEHLRRIDASHQQNPQPQPGIAPILDVGPFFDKRTGPIVAIAAGPLSQSEAQSLLGSVNYAADVTWNQNTYFDKRNNIANLVWNALLLCAILIGIALVSGVAFGGIHVLLRRLLLERWLGRTEEMEFISLHLSGEQGEPANQKVSSSINAS